jgi:predicted nuclease of predicted toxin-antitoxin system
MKLKLDENLGDSVAAVFGAAGHDVLQAVEQGLGGRADEVLAEVCRVEERCLVTLDLDFANPLAFPPGRYAGIVVLRLPREFRRADIDAAAAVAVDALRAAPVTGKLWVIRNGRVREHSGGGQEP